MAQPEVVNNSLVWPTLNAAPSVPSGDFISSAGNAIQRSLSTTLEVAGQLLPIWTANTLAKQTGQQLYAPTYQGPVSTNPTTAPVVQAAQPNYTPLILIGAAVLVAVLVLRR